MKQQIIIYETAKINLYGSHLFPAANCADRFLRDHVPGLQGKKIF